MIYSNGFYYLLTFGGNLYYSNSINGSWNTITLEGSDYYLDIEADNNICILGNKQLKIFNQNLDEIKTINYDNLTIPNESFFYKDFFVVKNGVENIIVYDKKDF